MATLEDDARGISAGSCDVMACGRKITLADEGRWIFCFEIACEPGAEIRGALAGRRKLDIWTVEPEYRSSITTGNSPSK